MIINHNMNALNAHRNMGINNTSAGKAMEKLSSGLRINRAGDDAAGLAISEKMRGQIRGLDQASRNAQDGISLIQTAEGALNETHNILQRMRELAVQSSTDTNVTSDREAIQSEMDQLTKEIDRISNTTEFNTQKLLDGSFDGKFQIGANETQSMGLTIGKISASGLGLTSTVEITETQQFTNPTTLGLADGDYTVDSTGAKLLDSKGNSVAVTDAAKITVGTSIATFTETTIKAGASIKIEGGKATITNKLAAPTEDIKDATGAVTTAGNHLGELSAGNYEVKGSNLLKDNQLVGTYVAGKVTVNGKDILEADLGFAAAKLIDGSKFTVNGSDVSTRTNAEGSISSLDKAISTVSKQRSELGAVQNRLEHTVANLDNTSENLTAAESRIRDVDMASEMMEFSKNNILNQAAQAMLAQANQQPQNVLQLLR